MMSTDSSNEKPVSLTGFPQVPILLSVILYIVTFSLYIPYWMYTRTQILNRYCPENPVPAWLVALCIGGFLMLAYLVFEFPYDSQIPDVMTMMNHPEFIKIANVAGIFNIFMMLWSILFMQRYNRLIIQTGRPDLQGSYFWLIAPNLLLQGANIFYLQYKINQHLDQHSSGTAIM